MELLALRAVVHVGLLWQHLVKEKTLGEKKTLLSDGHIPLVLPVVLYNGDRPWAAPLVLRDLIDLPGGSPLWRWQPEMGYHLVDEGGFDDADLERRDTLPALLFRLENAETPERIVAVADAVLAWFGRHTAFAGPRTIFAELLTGLTEPLTPEARVPEGLLEVRNMLATKGEAWK